MTSLCTTYNVLFDPCGATFSTFRGVGDVKLCLRYRLMVNNKN